MKYEFDVSLEAEFTDLNEHQAKILSSFLHEFQDLNAKSYNRVTVKVTRSQQIE